MTAAGGYGFAGDIASFPRPFPYRSDAGNPDAKEEHVA
jgi:hypothetical protein